MATFHKVLGQDEQCVKKFRRRQSDARWRANLASCYETLKLVIPLTTRASKKQISKVVKFVLMYIVIITTGLSFTVLSSSSSSFIGSYILLLCHWIHIWFWNVL